MIQDGFLEEVCHELHPRLIVELFATMFATGEGDVGHGQTESLISMGELHGLLLRHLWVGIAMDEEQWWVSLVEMGDGARELGECGSLLRQTTEEKFERGDAHAQAVLSALAEDGVAI